MAAPPASPRDAAVDVVQLRPQRILRVSPRQNPQQEDATRRRSALQPPHNQLDPLGDLLGPIVGQIIRSDQDDKHRGGGSVEVSVVESPQQVLRPIAADSKICRVEVSKKIDPQSAGSVRDVAPGALPALGDRVAQENDLRLPLAGDAIAILVLRHPIAAR